MAMSKILSTAFWMLNTCVVFGQKMTIQFDNTPISVAISKAKLKYNKDFAYSLTFDDGTDDAVTTILPVFKGGKVVGNNTTYTPLTYTDGCGNAIAFRGGIAWNTANLAGIDIHVGNAPGMLTWSQLDSLYGFGWDVFNHTYSHKALATNVMREQDYNDEISKNSLAVRQRTKSKIEMPIFIPPSSDTNYHKKAFQTGHRLVFDQQGSFVGYKGLQVDDNISLGSLVIHRQGMEESIHELHRLEATADKSVSGKHFWYNEFTHRMDDFQGGGYHFNLFQNYMQRVANRYGKNGSDRMWMAPLQEVYEYLVMRQTTNYALQVSQKNIIVDFDLKNIPTWLRRKVVTLVVHSTVDFSKVTVPAGVTVTFKGNGVTKLINLDFSNWKSSTPVDDTATTNKLKNISIYPNPVKDALSLEVTSGDWDVRIFNEMGQLVAEKVHFRAGQPLNVAFLNQGIYFMLMQQGDKSYRSRFVKVE
jgi:Polysaccharide deacetylase/Secretion system C-terminal sorting domain